MTNINFPFQKARLLNDHELGNIHLEMDGTKLMKIKPSKTKAAPQPMTAVQRGQAAAKAMARELRVEHKRWNLPQLSWKDGKVVASKP